MRYCIPILASALLLTACRTSAPARQAAERDTHLGSTGTVRLADGNSATGELLAVEHSAFVLLTSQRIVVVLFNGVSEARFGGTSSFEFGPGRRPRETVIKQWRDDSRFPFGMTQAAMRELLAATLYSQPDTLNSRRP